MFSRAVLLLRCLFCVLFSVVLTDVVLMTLSLLLCKCAIGLYIYTVLDYISVSLIINNRSTTDQIFCIRQTLEKKWEYNETTQQLFVDFKKAYDSVRREVLYNILIEFGVPTTLVKLKIYLNRTYSKVRIGKYSSDNFPIQNFLKQVDALSPFLFTLALEYAIRTDQEN
jgi:hypothetical protein